MERRMVSDPAGRHQVVRERIEALWAQAARERMARSFELAGRGGRPSMKVRLGLALFRAGGSLSGGHAAARQPGRSACPARVP